MPSRKSPTKSSAARSRTGSAGAPGPGRRLDPEGFDAWWSSGAPLPRSFYLSGSDEAAKAEALSLLRDRWAEGNPEVPPTVLRAGEAGVERVLAEAQGSSLFAPASFVLVLNVEEWVRSARTVDAAAEGMAAVPEGNAVVLVESAAENERKTLVPLREACVRMAAFDALPPEVLGRWAARRLERAGVSVEPGVVETVLALSRLETGEVMNEIDKLADWAASGATLTRSEAESVLRPVHSGTLAELSRSIAEQRPGDALDHLLRSLEAGEGEGTILFQMQTLVSGALRLKSQQWGRIRDRENSERLARGRSERQLSESLDLLYRVERAWKGGRADVKTLLVRAVMGLATGTIGYQPARPSTTR
jgi:DNA polymerase III delta subunit